MATTTLETRPPAKNAKTAAAADARARRRRLPAVLMRAGTSRGLFLHRHDLPDDMGDWGPLLIAAMGSRLGDPRQLEGVGGATSTTSKVAVIGPSSRPGVDVEYTFVQVTVGAEVVDLTGNCGNMASGVAAFAVDEGLVAAESGSSEVTVSVYNTNTDVQLEETIAVDPTTGLFNPTGDYRISGVKGPGSLVKVKFMSPGGSMTGKTFPTGLRQQTIHVTEGVAAPFYVTASLVDVSNPFVFVDARTMPAVYDAAHPDSEISVATIEAIRRRASVLFGFAANTITAGLQRGTPKISLLSSTDADNDNDTPSDIHVFSYSMGKAHPSFQLTGAVCLGAAVCLDGTVAADLANNKRRSSHQSDSLPPTPPLSSLSSSPKSDFAPSPLAAAAAAEVAERTEKHSAGRKVIIQHRSGTLDVEVDIAANGQEAAGVTVYRTARRVFEGVIYV
jgi:2-methylaconitate cis-trans-isomerase PrpF